MDFFRSFGIVWEKRKPQVLDHKIKRHQQEIWWDAERGSNKSRKGKFLPDGEIACAE